MIKLHDGGVFLLGGDEIIPEKEAEKSGYRLDKEEARKGTIAWGILKSHNKTDDMENLHEKFDAMVSHDITYVGIIQTARASGMEKFPLPYVLTCCHNSLCAVGGTINEDDHVFGLSAAKKYGGIFVPAHMAVCHQYMRENFAGCGKMILGSDSHTRYGALGTLAIGEGGGELAKQLLEDTYDIRYPGVVCVYLTGKPQPGIGPHDIALAIEREVYKNSYVKNKVMEFVGPGVSSMTTDYRNAVDVMTTETACLSSVWRTDEDTKNFLEMHHRGGEYKELNPAPTAYYDGCIEVDLSAIEPMIALPFHPSNVYTIRELCENPGDILRSVEKRAQEITNNKNIAFSLTDKIVNGKIRVQQGVIAGCAGGNYVNVMAAAHILGNARTGNDVFHLDVYPSSQPVFLDLIRKGAITTLMQDGAAVKTAFCGPCFGAGDTPANNELSIRHTTRNFPNREGSKPGNGQLAAVALMDARSIAATAANGGVLTPATKMADDWEVPEYDYDDSPYESRVYNGWGKADPDQELISGPNIKPWPEMEALAQNILLRVDSKIMDEVTTTDELIPSGETSSYRSNPIGLAQFTLSRRDPEYVGRAKETGAMEKERVESGAQVESLGSLYDRIREITPDADAKEIEIGSMIYCVRPGDGSAREQAASCQRVLGGLANICREYATKRYRSNVMNWGMVPFQMKDEPKFEVGDYIYVPGIHSVLESGEGMSDIKAYLFRGGKKAGELSLYIADMTELERQIVLAGCLINFNRNKKNQ